MKISRATLFLILLCGVASILALLKQPSVYLLLRQNRKLLDSLKTANSQIIKFKKMSFLNPSQDCQPPQIDKPLDQLTHKELIQQIKDYQTYSQEVCEYWKNAYYELESGSQDSLEKMDMTIQIFRARIDLLEELLEKYDGGDKTIPKNNREIKDKPKIIPNSQNDFSGMASAG